MKRIFIPAIILILIILFFSTSASAQQSQEIHQIQVALQEFGYNPGPLDGYWGKTTEDAVKQFQQDQSLPVTGRIDTETRKRLGLGFGQDNDGNGPKRLALVIGNGAYKSAPLKNPPHDAADMTERLKKLGFQVIHKENADQRIMKKAIREFGRTLRKNGGIGLFYFAGHGIQVDGRNYLIPVNAMIETESDIEFESVDAGRVLGQMEEAGNPLNIVLLDACRDNPFERSFRTNSKGLARMDAPRGSLIAYATAPGATAADGEGRNGVYTKHLLSHMATPGIKVEDVLKRVRVDVIKETGNKQIPWESSSMTGDFYFNHQRGITVTLPLNDVPPHTNQIPSKNIPKDELELALLKLKQQKEAEKRKQEAILTGFQELVSDLKKYHQIKESNLDTPTKDAAWGALARKYPKYAMGASKGDTITLLGSALSGNENESLRAIAEKEGFLKQNNAIGMNFVYLPPGSFMMGSPANESDHDSDEKQHRVTLTKGFYIQTTEVTQGQWKEVMGNNPSDFNHCGDDCPVEQVSWNDAQDFLSKLNRIEGTSKYRLPTEAEWEYAARAGSTTRFCFGDDERRLGEYAWYDSNSMEKTHTVAKKRPNTWGLYDMHGNVWEWCQVRFGDYPSSSVADPNGPSSGSHRVYRGGSWISNPRYCWSAFRGRNFSVLRNGYLGIRLAFSLDQ
jgi:formylglycine-generating enzyme required for sulfatase activity